MLKKGMLLFLALLLCSGVALGETKIICTLSAGDASTGDALQPGETLMRVEMLRQEGALALSTSLLPDQLFWLSTAAEAAGTATAAETEGDAIQPMNSQSSQLIDEWLSSRLVAEENGLFTGDAFSLANSRKRYAFYLNEALPLLTRLRQLNEPLFPWLDRQTSMDLLETIMHGDMWYDTWLLDRLAADLSVYDGGSCLSMTLKRQEAVLLTFSMQSEQGKITAVIGHAENGKNYYDAFCLEMKTGETLLTDILYADVNKQGFAALSDRNRLLTATVRLTPEPDYPSRKQISCVLEPANELQPLSAEGLWDGDYPEELLCLRLHYGNSTDTLLTFQVAQEEADPLNLADGKAVSLTKLTEQEILKLTTELTLAGTSALTKLMLLMPVDLSLKWMGL